MSGQACAWPDILNHCPDHRQHETHQGVRFAYVAGRIMRLAIAEQRLANDREPLYIFLAFLRFAIYQWLASVTSSVLSKRAKVFVAIPPAECKTRLFRTGLAEFFGD